MKMFDWLWRLLGYRKVWLEDFDGELNHRWAKPIRLRGLGEVLLANRLSWFLPRMVILLPNGTVEGKGFVKRWWYEE